MKFEDTDGDESESVTDSLVQQLQRIILDYLQDMSDTEPSLSVS